MKKYISGALCAAISLVACHTQKKISYNFPAAMQPDVRAGFTEICDKGQVLYGITCGKCHNVTVNGKQKIPDFTAEQIKGYEIRVLNPQHESSMPDEKVTAEELGQISTFLMYKKKSGVLMTKPKMPAIDTTVLKRS